MHPEPTGSADLPAATYAQSVMQRCDELGGISEEPDRLTRRYGTEAMRRANETVAAWMREASMTVRQDNVGNLIGRYEGGMPTLLLGSHLDTVRDAGKYDGPLGVMIAIACVQRLHDAGRKLPYAIEVAAFADEEGLRFHTAYLGSKVFAGSFDPEYLALSDADGITLAEAIRAFVGDPNRLQGDGRAGDDLLGYCEVHIEQGPVLEAEGLPVGIVSAIAGQERMSVEFRGEAGHAGTVPMRLRRDALCAAAEFVLAVEKAAREQPGLVATVGQMSVQPGASNVIPGHVTLSLDVRHMDYALCRESCGSLRGEAERIAGERDVTLEWRTLQSSPSVPCDPWLAGLLAQAVEEAGHPAYHLSSGAGHDAVIMSAIAPVAMLFVRCEGGISHNPAESVAVEDVEVAIDVMGRFLDNLASYDR